MRTQVEKSIRTKGISAWHNFINFSDVLIKGKKCFPVNEVYDDAVNQEFRTNRKYDPTDSDTVIKETMKETSYQTLFWCSNGNLY